MFQKILSLVEAPHENRKVDHRTSNQGQIAIPSGVMAGPPTHIIFGGIEKPATCFKKAKTLHCLSQPSLSTKITEQVSKRWRHMDNDYTRRHFQRYRWAI